MILVKYARKHHYLSRFYLSGFTRSEKRMDPLYVFDLEDARIRQSRPSAEAFENDYHRVDIPGLPPDTFEKMFSRIEKAAAKAIANVTNTLIYSNEELEWLLSFLALTTVRTPWYQDAVTTKVETESGLPFIKAIQDPSRWQMISEWLEARQFDWNSGKTARILRDPAYATARQQIWRFFNMLLEQDILFSLIAKRTWSLNIVADGKSDLICSDNPMGLFESPPSENYLTPSFTDPRTVITFPLKRQLALVGNFEPEPYTMEIDQRIVALTNLNTLSRAKRFLYSPSCDFACFSPEKEVDSGRSVLSILLGRTIADE